MPGGLLTDLYELTMASSYLRRDMTEPATFSLYVRDLPQERGFIVASGLEACLDFLQDFAFEPDDLQTLERMGFDQRSLASFEALRFHGDVWAAPEGTILYGYEPIMEVTAPLPIAQIVETALLNQITLHTTLASKAARYIIAAEGRDLIDFAFRRAHGIEAAAAVARNSALVGFVATSNVDAAAHHGLPVAGTMAHAYVEAFASERDAFRAFAEDHPGRTTFLVDTYDTMNGVRNAIATARALGVQDGLAIRLDSGDLGSLAREARGVLDASGFSSARIVVSGGLDEHEVHDLVSSGAPIDAFGIGTQLGVSADAPYVDSVYKLVEHAGKPAMKLSAGKVSAPGRKQVWRQADAEHVDVIGLRDDPGPAGFEPVLSAVMADGRRIDGRPSIQEMRTCFQDSLRGVPDPARRLRDPVGVVAGISPALQELATSARKDAAHKAGLT